MTENDGRDRHVSFQQPDQLSHSLSLLYLHRHDRAVQTTPDDTLQPISSSSHTIDIADHSISSPATSGLPVTAAELRLLRKLHSCGGLPQLIDRSNETGSYQTIPGDAAAEMVQQALSSGQREDFVQVVSILVDSVSHYYRYCVLKQQDESNRPAHHSQQLSPAVDTLASESPNMPPKVTPFGKQRVEHSVDEAKHNTNSCSGSAEWASATAIHSSMYTSLPKRLEHQIPLTATAGTHPHTVSNTHTTHSHTGDHSSSTIPHSQVASHTSKSERSDGVIICDTHMSCANFLLRLSMIRMGIA